ncbi:MAG: nodulation protein NfeD [Anaerolineales bacterium]
MRIVLLALAALFLWRSARAQTAAPVALLLTADGPVSSTMQEYIQRGLRLAERRAAEVVILQLDTPGGSIDLMGQIVQNIRNSRVPVVVYVAPRGAMAGSAGTLITLAGHVAAMAPETMIDAASPVGAEGEDIGETMEQKIKEATKATARALAERRGAEAIALAEATIEDARAVSSTEALAAGLIDLIASDPYDLLRQLDGRSVTLTDGERVLHTANATLEEVPLSLAEELLLVLANPNIVFLLLAVGVQALFIELSSPGGWLAGFIGVVCLSLAIYGLGVLPVNWFGLIFIATAFVLFFLELKTPTFGALTAAGVGSFILGALVLFNSADVPQMQRVSVPLVVATALATAGLFGTIVGFALRSQKRPVVTGQESLVGCVGNVRATITRGAVGQVQLGGELWSAENENVHEEISRGETVTVVAVKGLRLVVRKIDGSTERN